MQTVAIIHGWAEGKGQSRQFVHELAENGFKVINDVNGADIIFAHSSGCYLVPKHNKAKLILLVGLPYWPNRSLATGVIYKLFNEVRYHRRSKGLGWWLNKMLHNGWYILTKPQASYYLLTKHGLDNLPDNTKRKVLLVRPSDDTLMHPEIKRLLNQGYDCVEIAGAHDNCWMQPKPYIDLML